MGRNSHIPAADTEQFIIEKASELFNKKGYWGTSLSDLEMATGLTKGSIYANFKDKEEVSLKVFEFNHRKLRLLLVERISEKTTSKEKLLASVDFYIEYFPVMKASGGCAIQNALVDADDTHAALFNKAKAALKGWKENMQSIIQTGIDNGEIGSATNSEHYASYLIAVIEGSILVGKSLDNLQVFEAILTHLKNEIIKL